MFARETVNKQPGRRTQRIGIEFSRSIEARMLISDALFQAQVNGCVGSKGDATPGQRTREEMGYFFGAM